MAPLALPDFSELDINDDNFPSDNVESEDKLIVGLDFGTTYSGIAWAVTPQLAVNTIKDWPGLEGQEQPKVPTKISYDPDNSNNFAWGGQKTQWPTIEAVKLLLDPDQPKPHYLPSANDDLSKIQALGKSAIEVAADYIGAIYNHGLNHIQSKIPRQFFHQCQKNFVISVPAVWSDKAKESTEKAAKLAGIHPVQMVKEPEAAALYTLHSQQRALRKDDAFVVCDAGGGTVDLISYEVKQVSPKLEVGELVPSKGGMAGSLGLNKRFAEKLKEIIGDDSFLTLKREKGFQKGIDQFDREVKRQFEENLEEDCFVNFPLTSLQDHKEHGIMGSTWQMNEKHLKEIFDPLIEDILGMVKAQVDSVRIKRLGSNHPNKDEIKAIFLVGGFGSNRYLKHRMEAMFPDIQVLQPVDAWSAIVNGAVLQICPQQARVSSYVAQKHYGVDCMSVWNKDRDEGRRKRWCPGRARYEANTMQWYIHKGTDLQRDRKIRFSFFHTLDDDYTPEDLIFELRLIESALDQPPVHPKHGVTSTNVTLNADLRKIDRKHIDKYKGKDGKTYYDVHYELTMRVAPALFKFALEIEGKEMGSVEANYE